MKPVVSIITPYRNARRFLRRFVSSIQAQTRTDWVCIMVDDGSSDHGPDLLRQMVSSDSRFQLISNTNTKSWPGPASARNCALSNVCTELVAFCDVDDLWHPQKLERQLAFHVSNKLDLSVSAYCRFLDDQIAHPPKSIVCPPLILKPNMSTGRNPIPMLTVVISAELARLRFKQIPHEDFLFWLETFRIYPYLRYGCLPYILSFYCIHKNNLSNAKLQMPGWTYSVFRNYGKSRISSAFSVVIWLTSHLSFQYKLRTTSSHIQASTLDLLAQPPYEVR